MGIDTPKINNDVPTPDIENVESLKLEWGPDLGIITWDDAQEKIAELNSKLTEGEKPWRLPTTNELVAQFKETGLAINNFEFGPYWSSITDPDSSWNSDVVNMGNGLRGNYSKNYTETRARCVR